MPKYSSRSVRILTVGAASLICIGVTLMAATAEKKEPGSEYKLERVPAMAPEQSMASMEVAPGYRIELVASEPQVIDPVAISTDENGQMYQLIRGPRAPKAMKHKAAMKWAAEQSIYGHSDFTLPTRRDLSLLKATSPEAFRTDDWYWSSERHPDNENRAYAQDFHDGNQNYFDTFSTCFACAVRIVSIQ